VPEVGPQPIGELLLIPHKSYYPEIYPILDQVKVKAMAHITGGGLIDNPPRVLPDGCRIRVKRGSWAVPPLFKWMVKAGNLSEFEAFRSLNMGVGMVLIVPAEEQGRAQDLLRKNGGQPWVLGDVVAGEKGVEFI
jgi:phosphoribosylformylglycinamidine cyclo-ligase